MSTDWDLSSLENTTFHDSYHPLSQIEQFLQQLAHMHAETARLINIGRSAEGRNIFGLTISTGNGESEQGTVEKKKVRRTKGEKFGLVIQGAQHAREVLLFFFQLCLWRLIAL